MSRDAMEFIVLRTTFVVFAVLLSFAIGALFSLTAGLILGGFQFVLTMALTHKRIGLCERATEEEARALAPLEA
jgi:hypothetical protein